MNNDIRTMAEMDRRALLKAAGIGALAVAGTALSSQAHATTEDAQAAVKKLTGSGGSASDKITIDLPEIAENGATVPVSVNVASAMSGADTVKDIHVLAEGNPNPEVISFHLTEACGKAGVSTRIRLGKTQNVAVAVVMADGSVLTNRKEVKVTIGGCGG